MMKNFIKLKLENIKNIDSHIDILDLSRDTFSPSGKYGWFKTASGDIRLACQ